MATKPIFVVDNGAYVSKSKMNTTEKARFKLLFLSALQYFVIKFFI